METFKLEDIYRDSDYLRKIQRPEDDQLLYTLLNPLLPSSKFLNKLYSHAQDLVKRHQQKVNKENNEDKHNNCDWEIFGGYENFRDFYFNEYENYHFNIRFYYEKKDCKYLGDDACILCGWDNQHDCEIQDCKFYYDLQQPYPQLLNLDLGFEKMETLESHNTILNKVFSRYDTDLQFEYRQGGKFFENRVSNCFCKKLIPILEKQKQQLHLYIVFLKAVRNSNQQLYNYLTQQRFEKLEEIIQFLPFQKLFPDFNFYPNYKEKSEKEKIICLQNQLNQLVKYCNTLKQFDQDKFKEHNKQHKLDQMSEFFEIEQNSLKPKKLFPNQQI